MDKELREEIAKHIFHELHPVTDVFPDYWGTTDTMDDESWRRLERHCLHSADKIFILFKEAGYVQLAEDQNLPAIPEFQYDKQEDRELLKRGAINYSKMLSDFRRVEL